jgi:hypothetical protein
MQKIFDLTPVWTHLPLLLGYGVVQPFLPAALVARSKAQIWPFITIWRSVGWTFMLVFLVYAPILAIRKKAWRGFVPALILVVWFGILLASLRGGGDLSDNPRYRAVFVGLQASLAAWAWITQRRSGDPWLRRALFGIGAVFAWFVPWYLFRYYGLNWPIKELSTTFGLGMISASLLIGFDWIRVKISQ